MGNKKKKYTIEDYRESYNEHVFKDNLESTYENGQQNPYYYKDFASVWKDIKDKNLDNVKNLNKVNELLKGFNDSGYGIIICVVELYKEIYLFKGTDIRRSNISLYEIQRLVDSMVEYDQIIKDNIRTDNYSTAIRINNYYLDIIDEVVGILKNHYTIDLLNSPLKKGFKAIINRFKSSIDVDRIKILIKDKDTKPDISADIRKVLSLKNKLIPSQTDLNIPYNYFSPLTTETNNNGEFYLNEKQLLLFLKRAFNQVSSISKQKISKGSREFSKITGFFHEFMTKSYEYETSSQEGEKYIKILSNNFDGFDFKKVNDNWSKNPKKTINNK